MDIKGSEGWAALVYVMGSSGIVGYDTKTISDSKSIADGSYCGLQCQTKYNICKYALTPMACITLGYAGVHSMDHRQEKFGRVTFHQKNVTSETAWTISLRANPTLVNFTL